MLYANPWLIPMGDEMWLYYSGTARHHGPVSPGQDERTMARNSGIFRASIRQDGFVSADAGYGGGQLTTPVIRFSGRRLEFNCDGSAGGWLKVEIQDGEGKALTGYGLDEADAVVGNAVRKQVTWRRESDVSRLAGRPVRLRLRMRDIKLYAFQFCP